MRWSRPGRSGLPIETSSIEGGGKEGGTEGRKGGGVGKGRRGWRDGGRDGGRERERGREGERERRPRQRLRNTGSDRRASQYYYFIGIVLLFHRYRMHNMNNLKVSYTNNKFFRKSSLTTVVDTIV